MIPEVFCLSKALPCLLGKRCPRSWCLWVKPQPLAWADTARAPALQSLSRALGNSSSGHWV